MTTKKQTAIIEHEAAMKLLTLLKEADSFIIAIVNNENIRIRRAEDSNYHIVFRGENERLFEGELPKAIGVAFEFINSSKEKKP